LVFHFILFAHGFAWCHLQWDRYNLNVNFLIFFKKFYKVHNVEVLSNDPINKKNFSSLLITNLVLRFEPCVLNLIWKWVAKDPKKWEDHLIFISLGVKKFKVKNTQKKNLLFECCNLLDSMEWGAVIFWGWFPTRWLQDHIFYLLKFSFFSFLRNRLF
jgi:hypothetical protein